MKKSAGLLMYRHTAQGTLQVLLAHPGGPFWRNRDEGAWTLPKGEYVEPETAFEAACREFREETGFEPVPPFVPLGDVVQKSGKRISGWAFNGACEPGQLRCNTFEMEWPPRSGRRQTYPEIDRVEWFGDEEARRKIIEAQRVFLDRLAAALRTTG
jgi:predicted NUDIX family NTP pyrophosphohydrolase